MCFGGMIIGSGMLASLVEKLFTPLDDNDDMAMELVLYPHVLIVLIGRLRIDLGKLDMVIWEVLYIIAFGSIAI
jgi:hypothetical protein